MKEAKESASPGKSKPRSLFAQRLAQKQRDSVPQTSTSAATSQYPPSCSEGQIPEDILASMRECGVVNESQPVTHERIMEAREEILQKLSASNIEFLRDRASKKKDNKLTAKYTESTTSSGQDDRGSRGKRGVLDINNESLPINPNDVAKVPHMDQVEVPKLQWTMANEGQQKERTVFEARFDTNGFVLHSTADDSTWLKGLHSHGEDMDRPGYTFEELLLYARSTNSAQRHYALNCLAAIFAKSHDGAYYNVLSMNPLDLLSNVDVMCVIRKCLDFDDVITIKSSFACLASLLFPLSEEECYDAAYLFPNAKPFPSHKVTSVDPELVSDAATRDHQILTSDLLLFFIERSNLLTRIEFLVRDRPLWLSGVTLCNMLQILIRVARHSPECLLKFRKLLDCFRCMVTDKCNIVRQGNETSIDETLKLVALVLKMFRILIESSYANAEIVHQRFNLMDAVLIYLLPHVRGTLESTGLLKIVVLEAFRCWISSVDAGFGIQEISLILPEVTWSFTDFEFMERMGEFDGYYMAHLVHLLNKLIMDGLRRKEDAKVWNIVKGLEFFIVTLTMNALQLLHDSKENWVILLAGQGLEFLTTALKSGRLDSKKESIITRVKNLNLSDATHTLLQYSIILNVTKIRSRYPSNFISSGAILSTSKVVPIMETRSPFQFALSWLGFVQQLGCMDLFVTPQIEEYINSIANISPLSYFETYFIRFEQLFIFKALTLMDKEIIPFRLLVHLVCTLSKSDVFLFRELMKLMANKCNTCDDYRTKVVDLYTSCFFPDVVVTSVDESVGESSPNVSLFQLPDTSLVTTKLWILKPLEKLYSRYALKPADLKKYYSLVLEELDACLYFLRLVMNEKSIINSGSDAVEIYVLVTQIMSLGESLFLEDHVERHLAAILKELISLICIISEKEPQPFSNFKPRHGLERITNFQKYYGELVTDFQNVSYGSDIFSAYLLCPLIPTESTEIKQIFWSMQGLRFVRIQMNNDLIPAKYFTNKVDVDAAMLQIYKRLLEKRNVVNSNDNELIYYIVNYYARNEIPNTAIVE